MDRAVTDKALDRMYLEFQIRETLFREADLLDQRQYRSWLDMLADDFQYVMPIRSNVAYDDLAEHENSKPGTEGCWFDEDKRTIEMRVEQLETGKHWAEEPVSRVSHLVTNVYLTEVNDPEVEVSCRFLVYRNRVADETDFFVGRRKDRLRRTDTGDWKIVRREILLDQNVLLAKNLSIFI